MGNWYQVTKTIRGRKYDYWQKTYRVGKSTKTLNLYIGPSHLRSVPNAEDQRQDLIRRTSKLEERISKTVEELATGEISGDAEIAAASKWIKRHRERRDDMLREIARTTPWIQQDMALVQRVSFPDVDEVLKWRDDDCVTAFPEAPKPTAESEQEAAAKLSNNKAFKVDQVEKSERSDYERMRWGTKKYRAKKAAAKLRAAKKRLRAKGLKRINPHIGPT